MIYLTKAGLYKQVASLRLNLGVELDQCGVNILEISKKRGIKISEYPFVTPGLRGMAQIGDEKYPDAIILNSKRNPTEQNVDCAHECIHLFFHRNAPCGTFQCFEKALPNQNKYLEWQANEGGAELLVPFESLLSDIKKQRHCLKTYTDIFLLKEELAHKYKVTDAVISYRLESLKYEIEQFINGVPMQDLRILSYTSQMRQGINVKSLNEIAIDDLSKNFATRHCNVCQNTVITSNTTFCPICGGKSFRWGEGKMKYPTRIKVNENSKAIRCPVCDNEEIPSEGEYCPICGIELVNRCSNIDNYGNGCGALAAGNARHCLLCGAETTFYLNKLLKPWDKESSLLNADENFNIISDWNKIILEQGGGARSYLKDSILEFSENNCFCIVFSNPMNYDMGKRPTVLGELEKYISAQYGKNVYFKTRLQNISSPIET